MAQSLYGQLEYGICILLCRATAVLVEWEGSLVQPPASCHKHQMKGSMALSSSKPSSNKSSPVPTKALGPARVTG